MPNSIPEGLTRQHVLAALADLDEGIPHPFGSQTSYELYHDGELERYEPEAVIGLAIKHLTGQIPGPESIRSGEAPGHANYVLRSLGFQVGEKDNGFVASAGIALPEDEGEMADKLWFNIWRRRPWPWREVQEGDKLYWYDTTEQAIVWQSRIRKIERIEFAGMDDLKERLQSLFGFTHRNDSRFDAATDHGYCMAYKVNSLVRLNAPKTTIPRFPRGGWLRSDEDALDWLNAKLFDDLLSSHQRHRNPYLASWFDAQVFDDLRSAVEAYEKSGKKSHRAAAFTKLQKAPDNAATSKITNEMVLRLGNAAVKHGRRAARGGAIKRATPKPKPKPTPPDHPDGPAASALSKAARQAIDDGHFCPASLKDERKMRLREIAERRGQPGFRNKLIAAYGGQCAVTGCNGVAALEAAHIIPYTGPQSDHITNGVLLRADIHTLLDLDLIGIDPVTLTIALASAIKKTAYDEFQGGKLALPANTADAPNHEALVKRWKQFGGSKESAE